MTAIEFDVAKDAENQRKHDLPLAAAELLFNGPYVEAEDKRRDYGETRFVATGPVAIFGHRIFVVIYTWRGGARRIISFRKANGRETRQYQADHA